MNVYEQYMKEMYQPMRDELTNAGFKELETPESVDEFMSDNKESALVFVNSVCGCAAGIARPAAVESMENDKKPEQLVTVFAGQDREATEKMRGYFVGIEPSSPSMAIVKDGEVKHFIPREKIEGYDKENVVNQLKEAYQKYC